MGAGRPREQPHVPAARRGPDQGPLADCLRPGRPVAGVRQHGRGAALGRRRASQVGRVPSGWGGSLAFSPDGNELYTTGPGGVMRWPIMRETTAAGRCASGPRGRAVCDRRGPVARNRRRRHGPVASPGAGDGGLDIVPLDAPERSRRLGTHDGLVGFAISPDGRWAVSRPTPATPLPLGRRPRRHRASLPHGGRVQRGDVQSRWPHAGHRRPEQLLLLGSRFVGTHNPDRGTPGVCSARSPSHATAGCWPWARTETALTCTTPPPCGSLATLETAGASQPVRG